MPFLLTMIVGAAAGLLAVRFMNVQASALVAVAIGVLGAIVGGIVLRVLAAAFIGTSSVLSIFIGGLLGAVALIWIYRRYFK
ncbi:GlsB/YeaQ/YmgE family stress response membrane protein [Amylibacter sp. SFDW26]|uniref:GlsB/YeaQ/YmgE family stress response membrane protein n=1 Tax=Amylibacter sp. SFDW26 TaxID=2652722 RepID=UPI0012620D6D|nr:GlsB/YeaQ/YmgE family stress response membrane protein [Amylibacter sp. SFDW26]KAB7614797.1 GlsB/YeaQ/YmgE family stress response membrane protein [Amylibacter sp. SFDW26]